MPLARVRRALSPAGLRLVSVDACRDNPFAERSPASNGSISRGLAAEPPGASTVISFSAEPGQTAADGDGLGLLDR